MCHMQTSLRKVCPTCAAALHLTTLRELCPTCPAATPPTHPEEGVVHVLHIRKQAEELAVAAHVHMERGGAHHARHLQSLPSDVWSSRGWRGRGMGHIGTCCNMLPSWRPIALTALLLQGLRRTGVRRALSAKHPEDYCITHHCNPKQASGSMGACSLHSFRASFILESLFDSTSSGIFHPLGNPSFLCGHLPFSIPYTHL